MQFLKGAQESILSLGPRLQTERLAFERLATGWQSEARPHLERERKRRRESKAFWAGFVNDVGKPRQLHGTERNNFRQLVILVDIRKPKRFILLEARPSVCSEEPLWNVGSLQDELP